MSECFKYNQLYHYHLAFNCLKKNFINNKKINVLDYGCGDGFFISNISKSFRKYGYDVDKEKVYETRKKYKNIKFKHGSSSAQLPYKSNFFDVIFLFHVLEHVDSENRVVNEISRVLKKDGTLYISSPYKGLFAWADAANLRYRFPNLHKWFFITFLGKPEYEKQFVNRQSIGMYGDCSSNRNWHKHYTENELRQLLGNKFSIVRIYKFSLFYPFLLIPYNIINYFFKPKFNPILLLIHLDNLINAGKMSYNFFLVAKKK